MFSKNHDILRASYCAMNKFTAYYAVERELDYSTLLDDIQQISEIFNMCIVVHDKVNKIVVTYLAQLKRWDITQENTIINWCDVEPFMPGAIGKNICWVFTKQSTPYAAQIDAELAENPDLVFDLQHYYTLNDVPRIAKKI